MYVMIWKTFVYVFYVYGEGIIYLDCVIMILLVVLVDVINWPKTIVSSWFGILSKK